MDKAKLELPSIKQEVFIRGNPQSTTMHSTGTYYIQEIPDTQYFDDLEQILLCLQLNWHNQEYMIKALKNSIKQGYKLTR
jgi:hypothetical protein